MERAAVKIAEDLKTVAAGSSKPLVVAWAGAPEAGLRALREGGVCVLPGAARAVDAVHGLVSFAERRRRHAAESGRTPARPAGAAAAGPAALDERLAAARREGRTILGSEEAFGLLAGYGVRVPRWRLATTAADAARAAEEFNVAVALKVESAAILHKTDADAVRLGVRGADQAARAFDEVVASARRQHPAAEIRGVLVQEMVTGGTELVVGLHCDPQFGPVVMVGLGGIFVEVLEDVAFAAVPLTPGDAEAMLRSLRGARILEGARRRPPADRQALVELMLALSRLGLDAGGAIAELDLNPVMVLPDGRGAVAVDALVVLSGG